MKYFLYARKSTEDEEKQVLSLESQLDQARATFPNLDIIELPPESASAFKPYNRPVFDDMLKRIEADEAQGIVAWHPDRLSRNEVDAAAITYMVRTGKILDLKFCSYPFDNSPEGIMMLQTIMSHSQYFSAKLSKDVKRGFEKKLQMGWKPGMTRVGYLNTPELDKGTKIIIKDPERFANVRKMWEMLLSGAYTVPEILEIANNDWGFRTKKRRKVGGGPLSRSCIYDVFTDIFYTGWFRHNGELYKGKYPPMITVDEFDRAQMILGRKGKPRPQKHRFAFTGFIRCGDCGGAITAESKLKFIKSSKQTKKYTYYRCTWKRPCGQRKVMREEELERQIAQILNSITILPEFKTWAIKVLNQSNDSEIEDRTKLHITQSRGTLETQKELDNLTMMRYRDLIDDEEYSSERSKLKAKLAKLQENLRSTEDRASKWLELTEQTFEFATYAKENFEKGDLGTKKEIFVALGNNPTIQNGKLEIQLNNWFVPIAKAAGELNADYEKIRTNKYASPKQKEGDLASINAKWLRRPDSNRQPSP